MTKRMSRSALVLLAVVLAPPLVQAQTRATAADLAGVVMDQSKAVLPGATVTATNGATNLERFTTAEADGRFSIPALPPGTYTVKAALTGFTAQVKENIVLTLGESVLLAAVVSPSLAQAQTRATTADLAGVVMDQSKAVLPSATVTATNGATNLERFTIAEADGRF